MEAFLEQRDGQFVPGPWARGPWGEDSLHGRVLAGLFAREIEHAHGDPEFHTSRLTVDLFRMPRRTPLSVASEVVRGGQPPVPISVDLDGVKRISLLVDFADRGDELDHADWLDARLAR